MAVREYHKLVRQCLAYLSVFVPPTSIPITHDPRFVVMAGSTYAGPGDLEAAVGDITGKHCLRHEENETTSTTCSEI